MSDEISLRELLEVQEHFRLPSVALVEKDFHVVRALAAIAAIDSAPLRLVFEGGTALSRAHRLTSRMSEDIDLRIVSDEPLTRGQLRRLREEVTSGLLAAGFRFDPNDPAQRESRNESRYTIYRIPYNPLSRGEGALRPQIKIETSAWDLRLPAVKLPVRSFISEAFERPAEVAAVECVSIAETVADKFVALTRRVGAELADAGGERDVTLVRHIYDLHVARHHCDPVDVADLLSEVMASDAATYGNQFPAYRENPVAETLRAIEGLATNPAYAKSYDEFQRSMVYGDFVDYAAGIETLKELAKNLSQ